jgi:hypothetical protein
MPYTKVDQSQFELLPHAVIHRPTGARFDAYQNIPEPHIVNWGHAGGVLPNGDDYDRDDIQHYAVKLLRQRKLSA